MKRLLILLTLFLLSFSAMAKPLSVSLYIEKIKAIELNEKSGDEIYMVISEFYSGGKSNYYLFPDSSAYKNNKNLITPTRIERPVAYWKSDMLHKINNLQIWNHKLKDNEGVEIIVSFVERDAPPWDLDDQIGSIKIKLKNDNGHLRSNWNTANSRIKKTANNFQLKGDHSQYEVSLYIKQN